jgi:hypothetical protein
MWAWHLVSDKPGAAAPFVLPVMNLAPRTTNIPSFVSRA